jgi:AhpD family alkylhydroperoxidase
MEAKDIMNARIDLMHVNPGIFQAMFGLERQVRQARFDSKLLDLVRMRASQINGCAYCLDMHSKDARANGESEQRLYGLSACARRRTTRRASAPRWSGPKRSRSSLRLMSQTRCTSA